ncbi:hypothetical protein [Desnuesiella massiliensis]|uniref:hypothetical protein n=1 Tax=Desnuesiella massiliensis TaxID=1650662 RepID=UPI0006E237EB|nr:hypothetical protein [Desnuesiella massiliensis]
MDKSNAFDRELKSKINITSYHIKPSKDIFEEAWNRKDGVVQKPISFFYKPIFRKTAISFCSLIIILAALISISPEVRSFASNAYEDLRTIFIIKKSGNEYVVEKALENQNKTDVNYGGISINDSNKEYFKYRLGFSYYYPETISKEFQRRDDPLAGVTVRDITLKESELILSKVIKSLEDESYLPILKNYTMDMFITASYSNSKRDIFYLSSSKYEPKHKPNNSEVIKTFSLDGIECKVIEAPAARYSDIRLANLTEKPEKIVKVKYFQWEYNSINYSMVSGYDDYDINDAISFIEAYIKALKEQEVK